MRRLCSPRKCIMKLGNNQRRELLTRHKIIWAVLYLSAYVVMAIALCRFFIKGSTIEDFSWTEDLKLYGELFVSFLYVFVIICVGDVPEARSALVSFVSGAVAIFEISMETLVVAIVLACRCSLRTCRFVFRKTCSFADSRIKHFRLREQRRKALYEQELEQR